MSNVSFDSLGTERHSYFIDAATKTVGVDNTSFSLTSTGDISSTTALCMLCQIQTNRGFMKAKLYTARYWQNGSLVRDFVPVAIGDTGFLWDTVSGGLLGNSGTGAFGVGPELRRMLRVWGDGSGSSLFDISTPYPLAAGNPVTGTVNGDARSGILASNLYTVNDAGGNYVGEFINTTPGGTETVEMRWFDLATGSPLIGYCKIVQ